MTRLSVNIDHVATVRQARRASEPDPVAAAIVCELAGAHGITCHLRGDRRHIHDDDLCRLALAVTTPLNVEMAATAEMLKIAKVARPALVTLVPEKPGEVTTTGGIDAAGLKRTLAPHVRALVRAGLPTSLFIDPDLRQVEAAAAYGAGTVELNTNAYAVACAAEEQGSGRGKPGDARARAFDALVVAARRAGELGLTVAAGHGLTTRNVRPIADIPEVVELNIGHHIVARAVLVGLDRAVREMLTAIAA